MSSKKQTAAKQTTEKQAIQKESAAMPSGSKTRDGASEPKEKQPRQTEKLNVWLSAGQIAWLKSDREGPSAAVRALVTEAMNMQNLAKSLKKRTKR